MKRRGIIIALITVLSVLPFLFFEIPRWCLNAYVEQLKNQGERLDISASLPTYPPDSPNNLQTFRDAICFFPTNRDALQSNIPSSMPRSATGRIIHASSQPDVRGTQGTNTWEEIEEALKPFSNGLCRLEELASPGAFQFHLSYGAFPDCTADLSRIRMATEIAEAGAVISIHCREHDVAARRIHTLFSLSQNLAYEPNVTVQRVRLLSAQRGFATIWELLHADSVSENQLARIASDLSALEFIQIAEKTCSMERASTEQNISTFRNCPSPEKLFFGNQIQIDRETKILITVWQSWSGYLDELLALKGYQTLINNSRILTTNRVFAPVLAQQYRDFTNGLMKLMLPTDGWRMDANLINPFSEEVGSTYFYLLRLENTETMRQLTSAAVALHRYRLQNGTYPQTLSSLVPKFLPEIPLDPEDGNPLRYKLSGERFLLYSVGPNGIDDSGTITPQGDEPFRNPLDTVWPWPGDQRME